MAGRTGARSSTTSSYPSSKSVYVSPEVGGETESPPPEATSSSGAVGSSPLDLWASIGYLTRKLYGREDRRAQFHDEQLSFEGMSAMIAEHGHPISCPLVLITYPQYSLVYGRSAKICHISGVWKRLDRHP